MRVLQIQKMLETLLRDRLLGAVLVVSVGLHVALVAAGLPSLACPFQSVTTLPCPGCGLTHGILCLVVGDWGGMVVANPMAPYFLVLGGLVAVSLVLAPPRRESFARLVVAVERRTHVNALMLSVFLVYGVSRLLLELWQSRF